MSYSAAIGIHLRVEREGHLAMDSNNFRFRQTLQAKGVALCVLVEGKDGGRNGLDQFFNRIHFEHMPANVGDWVFVKDYLVKKEGNYA